jgi:putative transposon-encoded protein
MVAGIVLNLKGLNVLDAKPSKFGNGAHILISKKYTNKKIKVIVGKSVKISKNKIKLNLFGHEILERKCSKFGTGAHITVPKAYLGKKLKLIVEAENE